MNFQDFIKIRGLDSERPQDISPGSFEIFQGLGAEMISQMTVDAETGLVPVPPATPIPDPLWQGQNGLLQGEIQYCDQLSDLFRKKQVALPQQTDQLWGIIQKLLEHWADVYIGGLVEAGTLNPILAGVVSFLTEIAIGIGLEKLKELFTRGIALCDGIKADDQNLLELSPSLENYNLRSQAISQHTEQLENILGLINSLESGADRTIQQGLDTKGLIKVLKPVQDLDELPDIDERLQKMEALIVTFSDIKTALDALKYNDEEIDFGNARLHLRGKVIGA